MRFKAFKVKKFIAFIPCVNVNLWDTSYTLEIGWLKYFINIGIDKPLTKQFKQWNYNKYLKQQKNKG